MFFQNRFFFLFTTMFTLEYAILLILLLNNKSICSTKLNVNLALCTLFAFPDNVWQTVCTINQETLVYDVKPGFTGVKPGFSTRNRASRCRLGFTNENHGFLLETWFLAVNQGFLIYCALKILKTIVHGREPQFSNMKPGFTTPSAQ